MQPNAPRGARPQVTGPSTAESAALTPSLQLHLIAEPAPAAPGSGRRTGSTPSLAVTEDASFLLTPANEAPRLVTVPPESFDDVLILESLTNATGQLRLVVLNPAGHLRVNGRAVPRVALLSEKDEFNLNFGPSLFVTTWRQPRVGPPDAVTLGKPCPICRVPLVPDTTVYHCQCGCGLHCERPEDKAEPLQCSSLSDSCIRCNSPIIRESGFSWLPDFCNA